MAAPVEADRLYVSNERSGTIQVIDTATDRIIQTAKVHDRPGGLTLSPDGKRLYVAVSWWRDGKRPRSGRERIAAIDAATLRPIRDYEAGTERVVTEIPAGERVWGIAMTRDGRKLYAASSLSNSDLRHRYQNALRDPHHRHR